MVKVPRPDGSSLRRRTPNVDVSFSAALFNTTCTSPPTIDQAKGAMGRGQRSSKHCQFSPFVKYYNHKQAGASACWHGKKASFRNPSQYCEATINPAIRNKRVEEKAYVGNVGLGKLADLPVTDSFHSIHSACCLP